MAEAPLRNANGEEINLFPVVDFWLTWDPASEKVTQIVDHSQTDWQRASVRRSRYRQLSGSHSSWTMTGWRRDGRRIHLSSRQLPSLLHPRVSKDTAGLLSLTFAQSLPVWTSFSEKWMNRRVGREMRLRGYCDQKGSRWAGSYQGLEWGLEFRIKLAMGRHKTGHKVIKMGIRMALMQWKGGMLGFLQLIMERASE